MSISDLYGLKSKYESLRDSVNSAISSVNVVIENLLLPSDNIGKAYQKNETPIDNNLVKNARNNLIAKRDNLNNKVLPAINAKINEIKGSIEAAERAEAERRQREEEERNRAAQASSSAPASSTGHSQHAAAPSKPATTSHSSGGSRAGMPSNVPSRFRG